MYLGSAWWIAKSDRVHYVRFRSGDLKMLCWVYVVDGARAGRCAASAATTWAPYIERSEEVGGCDGLPSLETQPNCVDVTLKLGSAAEVACHFGVSGDRLPNHTEGH